MSQEKVFGLDKVHEFHLEVSAKEWAVMQKVEAGRTLFGAKKFNDDIERHMTAGFGLAFPWAHADLHAGGKVYKDVGLRYKGNGSYVSTDKMLKRNLKIEIDHYDDDQRFHGLKTITLNAGAVDASRMREALAYSVFRPPRCRRRAPRLPGSPSPFPASTTRNSSGCTRSWNTPTRIFSSCTSRTARAC
jgi:hypothetical protein